MRGLTVRLNDYSAQRAILMVVKKIPRHDGTAHLVKADMMIGRHSAPLVMNLPLWFGSGQPEQARLSSMNHRPVKPYATALHWRGQESEMAKQNLPTKAVWKDGDR